MAATKPEFVRDAEICVDRIIDAVGKNIVFAMPLALGKPNHIVNALYLRAKRDPDIRLTIMTALSLEKPVASSDLEARLLAPIVERIWPGFVEFEYMKDLRKNKLPENVILSEFFMKAGSYLNSPHAQQHYISSNYTHAARDIVDNGLNVLGTLIARHPDGNPNLFSSSCNPDLTLEVIARLALEKENGRKSIVLGQVNDNLPYMYGDAVQAAEAYDVILDDPACDFPLFSVPKAAVSPVDHMIGLYVSSLIRDNGTLQIGIGSLGDAIAASLIMRHKENTAYNEALSAADIPGQSLGLVRKIGGTGIFKKGLYGATEMLVDVFIELYKNGILKRKVYDHAGLQQLLNREVITETIPPDILDILVDHRIIHEHLTEADFHLLIKYGVITGPVEYADGSLVFEDDRFAADLGNALTRDLLNRHQGKHLKQGVVCHGSFFIGRQNFYDALNAMSESERKLFSMTGVDYVNQLFGDETLKSFQRIHGRFVNAGMKATLSGAIVSDGLENGKVISGVGGQYNFVSMAHSLADGRGIMMIRSTKKKKGRVISNIVFNYGHTTIPRHLRDIVVTEYGIADLRGKCDGDIIAGLLNITDSRFQEALLKQAKKAEKIAADYVIPDRFRRNTPDGIHRFLAPFKDRGFFPDFPFGTDFSVEEIELSAALKHLKERLFTHPVHTVIGIMGQFFSPVPPAFSPLLNRMKLDMPNGIRERILRFVVAYALGVRH
jgi:acyl-CoA hydrolase